jgi:Glycosyl transferase family 41
VAAPPFLVCAVLSHCTPSARRLHLAKCLFELGEIDAALDQYRLAAGPVGSALHREALATIAVIIPGSPGADNAAVLQARRDWVTLEPAAHAARPASPSVKLRVGYVSAFFGTRNWMKPVWGAINRHDRARFEIHLFCDGKLPSADSGYKDYPLDYIHNVAGAPNDGLADYIARAGIDILVDLNGYSFPDRIGLFIRRPARTIIGWFNMYTQRPATAPSITSSGTWRSFPPRKSGSTASGCCVSPARIWRSRSFTRCPMWLHRYAALVNHSLSAASARNTKSPTRWLLPGLEFCARSRALGSSSRTRRSTTSRAALPCTRASPNRALYDHHGGVVARSPGAHVQRRPLGEPH